jgi:hypothetical protein
MWHRWPRDVARGGFLAVVGLVASGATAWSCAAGVADSPDLGEAGVATPDGAPVTDDAGNDGSTVAPGEDATPSDDAGGDDASGDDSASPVDDAGSDTGARDARADASADSAPPDAAPPDAGLPDSGGHDTGAPVDSGQDAAPVHDASIPDVSVPDASDAGCSPAAILLNEVQTSGAGGAEDEWVEIFNPQSCAIDISGWVLKHTSGTGTSATTVFTAAAGTVLAPKSYEVIAGQTYSAAAPTIGAFSTGVLSDTGGGLGLYNASSVLIDAMGYGTGSSNPFVAIAPAPAEGASQAIARIPNGAKTGNNASDFAATTPTPGAAN